MEYATQDADPKVFEPLRKPINERAAAFRQRLVDTEPKHLDALLDFAARAYRRPLTGAKTSELRGLYAQSAQAGAAARRGVPADAGPRARRAGVSVSPREARPGHGARPGLRLGTGEPAELLPLVVAARRRAARSSPRPASCATRTMLVGADAADAARRARRAGWRPSSPASGCTSTTSTQLDEKSERHFPDVRRPARRHVRGVDPVLHRPVPARRLGARHPRRRLHVPERGAGEALRHPRRDRRRVAARRRREEVLARRHSRRRRRRSPSSPAPRAPARSCAATGSAKCCSARSCRGRRRTCRSCPTTRPRPTGLTVRQLVEKHSQRPEVRRLPRRIDPFGFALEGFDAIGRRRDKDLGDRPIDTRVEDAGRHASSTASTACGTTC